ncbi:DUF1640 domain-containing protein [Methylosinus sp. Sm6]|uniref:DUF1640 domain-containing protein n=1 Tax=Methylosinus sp. Sm6 TaxID=2866948 RepID=UPI001C99B206|nr:DUF1640 domain-containing protein [Methylosinus sp. Sm6]MBY6241460.1 DUF1640 domain-containing protein [Methylosinus sp. Sm6]
MGAVAFDTPKFARKLEAGGFTQAQATAAAEAFADATSQELATKSDLAAMKAELKADIELVKRDLKIWFGSVMVVAVILAAIRYLPAGH